MMGGKTTSTSDPKLAGIQVQTSTLGIPFTMGWGRNRAKCNLIWYNAFTAIPHTTTTGGGKGGSKSENTSYTYTASIILAIGEGPVTGVRTIYKDKSAFTSLAAAGLSLATGTPTQPVWGYLTSLYPAQARAYARIAYMYAQDYQLNDGAQLQNHSVELDWPTQMSGLADADPADILIDFLTNTQDGLPGWGSGLIGSLTDWSNYCRANNLLLSPLLETQVKASDFIAEITDATNSAPFWSEGLLKVAPYGDRAATGNGATWTPNLTPAYDLTENDFLENDAGPVQQQIIDQSDAYNSVQVEYLDRSNQYNVAIEPAFDDNDIALNGPRKGDVTTWHSICDADVARHAAQLLLQRTLYKRIQYTFQLPWNFVLLEPMDYVTLTTTTDELKLDHQLVRILQIDEDADGMLSMTAERVDVGTGAAALYASHSGSGYQPNYDIAPGSVSTPLLFIAPPDLLGSSGTNSQAGLNPEIWLAVASTSATWGGCQVWISSDDVSYSMVGTIQGPARYGTLTSTLASHVDPDNTNTLAVDLSASLGQLDGGTAADMNAGATLAWVDGEIISYQNATLTSAYHYSLAPLRRGLRGSTPAAHSSGTSFARLDDAIFKFGYDPTIVGDTIYVKLPSLNIFGRGLEDISGLSPYTIAISSAPGRAAFRDVKFQRSLSQPSTPTGDNPTGWSDGVPGGTEALWQIVGTKTIAGTLIGTWSTPQAISGLTPRGAYSGSATYYLDNTVSQNGGSYIAVQDNFSGHAPTGTGQANAWWDVLAAPGDPGAPAIPPSGFSATINLTSGAAVNLRTVADANGYTGLSDATITFNVPNGVTIEGLNNGLGIDTGTWPTGSYTIALTLVVQSGGIVYGGGGDGGAGGGGAGNPGGDAIYVRVPMTGGITINSGGTVKAGGGGGGGGDTTGVGGKLGGGGGGGGAPNGVGGTGDVGYVSTGTDGTDGTTSGGGAAGTPRAGAGGTFATAGTAGTSGAAGAAGYAVRKNGNTVTVSNSGTMTGTAA